MTYYRSYFQKNNTIVEGSLVNTAKNPNTEIFYGENTSKYIFKVDLDTLKSKVLDGDFVIDGNTTHKLHLTNTIFGDEALLGEVNGKGRERTTSFDLVIFQVPQFWDEGVGFDYDNGVDFTYGNDTYDQKPSNWFYRTSLDLWSEQGIYTGTPIYIVPRIHFDNGNEDLTADITSYINDILTGSTTDYGLGIAFDSSYLSLNYGLDQSVAFFSKYTQTFFEPYVETVFEDTINDNRLNFSVGTDNDLYLYVTKGTNYYDLDQLPLVDVLDSTNTPISGLTDLTTIKIKKGIYKVTFGLSGDICDRLKFFYDSWKNVIIDGVSVGPIVQKFIPKPFTSTYTIGANPTELERYAIQFFGVRLNEKIKRGDNRKIVVTFRSINQQISVLFDEVYYRIYIKEGRTQVNVFEWTLLDKTNENSFVLDTSYMIPREYWVEIKARTHTEEIFYRDEIKFEIISEK
jgi:hypothetical protein